ncbi:MAG: hypothetical protein ABSF38_20785 [Verrucomicrobiota bacterium]|jgi:hypothetical protein
MQYEELNGHFRERIRERVAARLAQSNVSLEAKIDTNTRDVIVLCIILLADENNVPKAADRLYEMKRTNDEDSITYDDALNWIVKVYEMFPTEISILFDLYKMQRDQEDILNIIAHMEMRLLEV